MRAIIGNQLKESMHVAVSRRSELEILRNLWLENLILAFSVEDLENLKSQIMGSKINSQWINYLISMLKVTPKTAKLHTPPIDIYLNNNSGENSFFDLYDNEEFSRILKNRRSRVKNNESRDEVFLRLFDPLASTAKKLILVDPFVVSEITNNREGAIWFLKKNIDAGIRHIEIFSTYRSTDHVIEKTLRNNLRQNLELNNVIDFRMVLVQDSTYVKNGKIITKKGGEHGRHCRYIYSPEEITPVVELEHGTYMFNREKMVSSKNIFALDFEHIDTAKDRENVYKSSPNKKYFSVVSNA